jgi:hypothetical protein
MNILWTEIKTATLIANRKCIPQLWISPVDKNALFYESSDATVTIKQINSILLKFRNKFIQHQQWPKDKYWTDIISTMSKITKKFDLPSFNFPAFIDQYNIIAIKAYLKDTHKTLLSYAKIELQKLKNYLLNNALIKDVTIYPPTLPK